MPRSYTKREGLDNEGRLEEAVDKPVLGEKVDPKRLVLDASIKMAFKLYDASIRLYLGKEHRKTTILVSRRGTECQIDDSCAPTKDVGGRIMGAVLVFRDITEAYEMREALRESEQKLKAVLNATPFPVADYLPDLARQLVAAFTVATKLRVEGLIAVKARLRDGIVTLVVRDDGVGMPEPVGFDCPTGCGLRLVEGSWSNWKVGSISNGTMARR